MIHLREHVRSASRLVLEHAQACTSEGARVYFMASMQVYLQRYYNGLRCTTGATKHGTKNFAIAMFAIPVPENYAS